jgi:hypothetical protein
MISEDRARQLSKIMFVVVFLALLRCIGELYRLHLSNSFQAFIPFIHGIAVCAVFLFAMTVLNFYQKYLAIAGCGIAAIIGLLLIKYFYLQ